MESPSCLRTETLGASRVNALQNALSCRLLSSPVRCRPIRTGLDNAEFHSRTAASSCDVRTGPLVCVSLLFADCFNGGQKLVGSPLRLFIILYSQMFYIAFQQFVVVVGHVDEFDTHAGRRVCRSDPLLPDPDHFTLDDDGIRAIR